ncbi:MAG: hypothetical protein ACSHX0_00165 [Akkermansiaceae bacterium]
MSTAITNENLRTQRIYKFIIMALPLGCIVGVAVFMTMYYLNKKDEAKEQNVLIAHDMRVGDLEDMVEKFTDRIGVRELDTEAGRKGLQRAASMIEGSLGPQNLGFTVTRSSGEAAHGLLWKNLSVDIRGEKKPDDVVFALVSYAGEGKVADANAVATMMMLVSSMAYEKPARTIRFVFSPLKKPLDEKRGWLLAESLLAGENSVAVLGIDVMATAPDMSTDGWQNVESMTKANLTATLAQKGQTPLWLTHSVLSSQAWAGNDNGRFRSTLEAAQEIKAWLLQAANQ